MPAVRRILNHVSAEVARGTRRCRRNRNHLIRRGDPCLVIQDSGTPYSRSYCVDCALPILKQSGVELRVIRDVLYGPNVNKRVPEQNPRQKMESATPVKLVVKKSRANVMKTPRFQDDLTEIRGERKLSKPMSAAQAMSTNKPVSLQ